MKSFYETSVCLTPNVKKAKPGQIGHWIPKEHAIAIKKRLESGMDYVSASPFHELTREEAAFLLNLPWKELSNG